MIHLKYVIKTLFLYLLILFIITQITNASFERLSINPRVSAIGNAGVCLFSPLRNPAISPPNRFFLSAAYSRPYNISEISESQINYGQKIFDDFHFGFSWHRLSLEGYSEDLFAFGLGYSIDDWSFGLTLDRFRLKIKDFGSCSKFGLDMGLSCKINEDLQAGLAFNEINRPELPGELPLKLTGGISTKVSPQLNISFELQKISDQKMQVRIGGEYELFRNFLLRTGVNNRPWEVSAGIGIRFMSYGIDYTWIDHPALQPTHQISVNILDW